MYQITTMHLWLLTYMMKKSFDNTTYKHHQNKDQIQIISINSGTDAKSIDRYEVAFKRDDRVGA